MDDDLHLLGERIAEHAAHVDAAMHRLLTDVRAFDQRGGWYAQGARSCAHWLTWRVGWSRGTAREHVRVAHKLGTLPLLDEALRRGEISYSKIRAITRVATPANEALLLEDARYTDAAQLELICRKYALVQRQDAPDSPADAAARRYVTRRDTEDGMVRIEAVLHPEEAAIVWAALERVATEQATASRAAPDHAPAERAVASTASCKDAPMSESVPAETCPAVPRGTPARGVPAETCPAVPRGTPARGGDATSCPSGPHAPMRDASPSRRPFDRADALVAIAEEVVRGTSTERAPIEVVLTITADAIAGRATDPVEQLGVLGDGSCVTVEAARRLLCDAGVVELTEDDHGTPLSVGRRTRTIPAAIKRAMLRRDQMCRFPGCDHRRFLQGHHVEHWIEGGETALGNLVLLCGHHHRFVHEHGYRIELGGEGPRFLTPRGHAVPAVPPPLQLPALGLPTLIAINAGLAITPETRMCGWDGDPIDYDCVIDELVRVDAGH